MFIGRAMSYKNRKTGIDEMFAGAYGFRNVTFSIYVYNHPEKLLQPTLILHSRLD